MKKIISLLICAVMIVPALCLAVSAASTVTITASECGFGDTAEIDKVEKGGVKVEFSVGTGSTKPVYYENGEAFRIYGGNTVTVTTTGTITGIKLTFASTKNLGTIEADVGTYEVSGTTGTWTGSASEIVFKNAASKGHARIQVIELTVDGVTAPVTETTAPEPSKPTTPEEIVNALYALGNGEVLADGPYTLEGVIKQVDTAYNSHYTNITVTMIVGNMTNKPVQCFRLEGDGVDKIDVGDTIKVEGELKNYFNSNNNSNTYEFDAKCKLLSYKKSEVVEPDPVYNTAAELLEAAYALKSGEIMRGTHTLTGTITEIKTPYNSQYGNVSVIIVAEGHNDKPMLCYRLINGQGVDYVDKLAVGDTITVTGKIKNYSGTVEFDANSTLDSYVVGKPQGGENEGGEENQPKTVDEILDALYALKDSETLAGPFTLTGVVKSIDTEFSSEYNNVTVTMVVEGHDDKPVMCYRLAGDGADKIEVGDTITVTGSFKNYKGTYEFNQGCKLDKLVKANKPTDPGSETPNTSDASVAVAILTGLAAIGTAVIAYKKKRV